MHPILQDRWRLFTYLAAWELLGFLFALLIVLSGAFSWSEALALAVPLSALYGLVCLGAFWVCWAAPLSGSPLRVQAAMASLRAADSEGGKAERTVFLDRALHFLRAELAALRGSGTKGRELTSAAVARIEGWLVDPLLAPVREEAWLASLPPESREAWRAFWKEVGDALH